MKENLSKLKDAEQKLRENPTVKENLAKLREAEQKFRDNPSVKENLSKLKGAEQKLREDAKSKQVLPADGRKRVWRVQGEQIFRRVHDRRKRWQKQEGQGVPRPGLSPIKEEPALLYALRAVSTASCAGC